MSAIIEVKNLTKEYVNDEVVTPVLYDISFKIEAGEFIAIMGPSGSGKSTLMHILGFLDKLSSGKFLFNGQDVSTLNDDELAYMRSDQVGFIFQAFNLLPRTSVLDNVILPLIYIPMNQKKRIQMAMTAIDNVGLTHRLHFMPNQLSGGEKQRVAIARALVNEPAVIFADEPTGNLDSKSGHQIMKILQDLNEEGHTIILVTHERYTAEHAKRILRIRDGSIEEDVLVTNRQNANHSNELTK